jgi:hypothetical protein
VLLHPDFLDGRVRQVARRRAVRVPARRPDARRRRRRVSADLSGDALETHVVLEAMRTGA